MYDRARALDLIERAVDTDPYCPMCGAHTEVADEDGLLVLRCAAAAETGPGVSLIRRLGARLLPHLRLVIVDVSEGVAA